MPKQKTTAAIKAGQEIPEGWREVNLGEVIKIRKGLTYKSLDYGDETNGLVFINLKCIAKGGGFNKAGIKYYKGQYSEEDLVNGLVKSMGERGVSFVAEQVIPICAKLEEDLVGFSEEERKEYLIGAGVSQTGLERLIRASYTKLGLISFLTAGKIEARAWTVKKGALAPQAAGVIHTDFEKKFIKAKAVSYDDFVQYQGWKGAAEAGKVRIEGKEYEMREGDVVEFMVGS